MSYSALARKWRPKSFAELKGQHHVAQALMNALSRQQLHHAYLFTGTRGVGKTTIARIMAKCLNCAEGVVSVPCNHCEHCVAIDAGRYLDLIEVDAASKTKVEETRELLDNVPYAPACGRYKVYLIDEVHMLSGHSFNALLKTLEEPPEHVKFILATTEEEKIPATILSRCLHFQLRALGVDEISEQLAHILTTEGKAFEPEALTLIAEQGKGSMRDALSVLDQAISYCPDSVTLAAVEKMLGFEYRRYVKPLMQHIIEREMPEALEIIHHMRTVGAEPAAVLESVLETVYRFSVQPYLKASEPDLYEGALPPPEVLQLIYQIGLQGQRDLPYAPNSEIGLEMTVLRMIAFQPEAASETETKKTIVSEPKSVAKKAISEKPGAQKPVAQKPIAEKPITQKPVAQQKTGAQQSKQAPWKEVIEALPLVGLSKLLLQHCTVQEWGERTIRLALDSTQEACLNRERQAQIQKALSDYVGHPVGVEIHCGEVTHTPSQEAQQAREQQQAESKAALLKDEKVQSLMDSFNATIESITYSDEVNGDE